MLTLRRKFAVLLVCLGITVIASQGTALWGILTLERELSWPLQSIQAVLVGLQRAKLNASRLAEGFSADQRGTPLEKDDPKRGTDPELARSMAEDLRRSLDPLDDADGYLVRSGISTTRMLRQRVEAASDLSLDAIADPSLSPQAEAALRVVHDLIERMQGHIIEAAGLEVDHGRELRRSVLFVSGTCVAALSLMMFLAMRLFGRWILRPVNAIRVATERIGRGEYEHRIAVEGVDELAQLSGEVNHMAATIAAMTQERIERERVVAIGEMVRRVAHNLRNPLGGIRSLAEVTRSELAPGSDLRDIQTRIIDTVDRFETWLRDLLHSTRPLELEVERVDVGSWVSDVITPLRPLADARHVSIEIKKPPEPLYGAIDPRHFEHAVVAVVTNAIQASPAGGRVTVAIGPQLDRKIQLMIQDEGPGVPLELRERIFEPYFTSKADGTGIGLALARHVINQHGGRISVHSPDSQGPEGPAARPGAAFAIVIPCGEPA